MTISGPFALIGKGSATLYFAWRLAESLLSLTRRMRYRDGVV